MKSEARPNRQTGEAPRKFIRHVEEHGIALRQKAGIQDLDRLDPFDHQSTFGIVIKDVSEVLYLNADDLEQLKTIDARTWSGSAQSLPDGRSLILLNPNQTAERAAVTVMEEVAHIHFGHKPVTLSTDPTTDNERTYDKQAEDEAYWTAAASLLPSKVVARAVWHGVPPEILASKYGAIIELVEFRIKTLRLWQWYRKYRVAA